MICTILKLFMTSILVLALSGCANTYKREDIGMVSGAVAGGIIGSALTRGSTAGTIAGTIGGGYLGKQIGATMDREAGYAHYRKHCYHKRYAYRGRGC